MEILAGQTERRTCNGRGRRTEHRATAKKSKSKSNRHNGRCTMPSSAAASASASAATASASASASAELAALKATEDRWKAELMAVRSQLEEKTAALDGKDEAMASLQRKCEEKEQQVRTMRLQQAKKSFHKAEP